MKYKNGIIVKTAIAEKDFDIDKYINEQWDKLVLQGKLTTYIIDKHGKIKQLKK